MRWKSSLTCAMYASRSRGLGRRKLGDYQVIVQNYCNWHDPTALSEKARTAFTTFLQEGGGLIVIHFANGAFGVGRRYPIAAKY